MQNDSEDYFISTDLALLQINTIHRFLRTAYWCEGIPLEIVERAIENSLCFGAYKNTGEQVGFARVVTDYATFAYLADVFILEAHRGQGLSKRLMQAIMSHPDLQGLRRWTLATRDAHELYRKFGFDTPRNPQNLMEITRPGLYLRKP